MPRHYFRRRYMERLPLFRYVMMPRAMSATARAAASAAITLRYDTAPAAGRHSAVNTVYVRTDIAAVVTL